MQFNAVRKKQATADAVNLHCIHRIPRQLLDADVRHWQRLGGDTAYDPAVLVGQMTVLLADCAIEARLIDDRIAHLEEAVGMWKARGWPLRSETLVELTVLQHEVAARFAFSRLAGALALAGEPYESMNNEFASGETVLLDYTASSRKETSAYSMVLSRDFLGTVPFDDRPPESGAYERWYKAGGSLYAVLEHPPYVSSSLRSELMAQTSSEQRLVNILTEDHFVSIRGYASHDYLSAFEG